MLLDFEIAHFSRRCTVCGRTLAPGEVYFSTLHLDQGAPVRCDYASDQWRGPAEGVVGWWRSRVPDGDDPRPKLAPNDVLLNLFAELADQPGEKEFRYVLGLLLLRRKLVRLEDTRREAAGEVMILNCPQREEQFELQTAIPTAELSSELQRRLVELLYSGA